MATEAGGALARDVRSLAESMFREVPPDIRRAAVEVALDADTGVAGGASRLAETLNLSPSNLKRSLPPGTTPGAMVAMLRAQVMRWWLHQGESCASAAAKAGYSDAASASNSYLRWMGHRPSKEVAYARRRSRRQS